MNETFLIHQRNSFYMHLHDGAENRAKVAWASGRANKKQLRDHHQTSIVEESNAGPLRGLAVNKDLLLLLLLEIRKR